MNGDDNCYVDAKELHESIGKPYSDFRRWYAQIVKPYVIESDSQLIEQTESGRQKVIFAKQLMSEISDMDTKPKRKDIGVKKSVFIPLDIAQDLAMLSRNEEGKEVRRYFRTVNRVFEKCVASNAIRLTLEKTSKAIAKHGGLKTIETTGKFSLVLAGKEKKRFNSLVAKITGHRNEPETGLDDMLIHNAWWQSSSPEAIQTL